MGFSAVDESPPPSRIPDSPPSRVSKSDTRELSPRRGPVIWERTVTYTGSDPVRHLSDGLPRPGLVMVYDGGRTPMVGCSIERPRIVRTMRLQSRTAARASAILPMA